MEQKTTHIENLVSLRRIEGQIKGIQKMIEEKKKQIVDFIVKTYVDPKTHLPHPPLRVEQAMKDGRVSIEPQKNVDEQVKNVVEKLRSIIALKSENLQLEITMSRLR